VASALLLSLALGALAGDDGRASLEAFLRRVRAERDAEYARLAPRVEELVRRLGQASGPAELRKLRAEFEALGSEAAPLLVPHLDPGASGDAEKERRASEVAALLSSPGRAGLLPGLAELAERGSPRGRLLATRVLGHAGDAPQALALLRALHPATRAEHRAESVLAIARLAPDDALVVAALAESDSVVLAAGLRALAGEARKKPRPEVLALLEDPERGARVLPALVAYLRVPGQAVDEDTAAALVRLAAREEVPLDARLAVLDGLPALGVAPGNRLRKELEPLLASSDSAVKDATLIALTLMKDARARRDLMRFYDEQVRSNEAWPLAYQRRADVELRIGENRDAARDYERAIALHEDSARLPGNRDLWVNYARALLRDNKLKAAADALLDFGLTAELRRALKADPDFQPLVEHARYGEMFE
jgi:hypothetical protein